MTARSRNPSRRVALASGDLFEAGPLPGLAYADDFLSPAEERGLIACIDAAGLTPFRFQQWTGKRLTRSFGWSYDFATGSFTVTDPLPHWLVAIRDRVAAMFHLSARELAQALVIRYDPGAGIGWHKDRRVFEQIIGISLGSGANLRFRRRRDHCFERVTVPLAPRSIYHLVGDARHIWEHSIAPGAETRWSVTFRPLAVRRIRGSQS